MKRNNHLKRKFSVFGLIGILLMFIGSLPAMAEGSTEYSHLIVNFKLQNGSGITTAYTGDFEVQKAYPAVTIAIPRFPTYAGYMPSLPVKPTAEGLIFDFSAADYKFTYSFDGTQKAGDIVVDIVFVPILNVYKAEYYHQKLSDFNQFEKAATEVFSGMTGSTVDVDAIASRHAPEGFVRREFNAPAVAADGSTVVKVFYDRLYYRISFDTDGAVESAASQYLPYGATIGTVATPTKPGYNFAGWEPEIPAAMPAANISCKAQWELASPKAKVSIVSWGENANEENYAYLSTTTVYAPVDSEYGFDTSTSPFACGKEEHEHSDECLACGHIHTASCYGSTGTASVSSDYERIFKSLESDGQLHNGHVYRRYRRNNTNNYYLYFNNQWYNSNNGSAGTEINNTTEDKYTYYAYDGETICGHHTASCYNCGKEEHAHTSACRLDTSLYTYNSGKSDSSVKVEADGTSVLNVYYDRRKFTLTFKDGRNDVYHITEKWGSDISAEWPINGYNNGERWSPSGTSLYTQVLVFMAQMPAASFTLSKDSANNPIKTMNYYLEVLPGDTWETAYDGMHFNLLNSIKAKYNYITKKEDFFDIEGFTQYKSNPQFSSSGEINQAKADFYYKRNIYKLSLNNAKEVVDTLDVPFEQTLGNVGEFQSFTPEHPDTIPEKYEFNGWSLAPTNIPMSKSEINAISMPASSLILYACWKKPEYEVLAYESSEESGEHYEAVVVYGDKVVGLEPPEREGYEFVGWFYKNGEGKELAFDSETMNVYEDMTLHAKWRNLKSGPYTVNFVEKDTGVALAPQQTGEATMDTTFNVTPKQISGYFPTVAGKSIMMTEGEENAATFEYIKVNNVPYLVKYVDKDDNSIYASKTVNPNALDVVTEKYVSIPGYIVDQAFITRYLSVQSGAPQPEDNTITFVYEENATDIMVTVEYYINMDLTGTKPDYQLYSYTQEVMPYVAGKAVTVTPLSIANYEFNEDLSDPVRKNMPSEKGDMEFVFKYDPHVFTVTYRDRITSGDEGILQKTNVLIGSATPSYVSANPVHPTEPDNYIFDTVKGFRDASGNPPAVTVTGDATYYAQWAEVFHVHHCTGAAPSDEDVVEHLRVDMVDGESGFDITAAIEDKYNGISSGCLYGGLWSDPTGSALREDVCGVELQPKTGDHYYVREISDGYLTPKTLSVRISGVYYSALVSAIDDFKNYVGLGFDVATTEDGDREPWTSTTAYESLIVNYAAALNKEPSVYTAQNVAQGLSGEMICSDAYLGKGGERLKPQGDVEQTLWFTPFFATKDSVKVFGKKTRKLTYSSTKGSSVDDDPENPLPCEKYVAKMGDYAADDDDETMRLSMILAPSFVLGSGDEGTSVNVTVNIGDLCTTVPVPSGTDLSDGITNPSVEGCVFAGWFRDEACTRPANLSCVTEDMEIYAGFLGGGYLKVAELPAANGSDGARVRIVSAVDTTLAASCGFIVSDGDGTREIQIDDFYDSIDGYTAGELFEGTDGFASLMCLDLVLAGVEGEGGVTVTPYWKPLCGAKVLGEAMRIMVNGK